VDGPLRVHSFTTGVPAYRDGGAPEGARRILPEQVVTRVPLSGYLARGESGASVAQGLASQALRLFQPFHLRRVSRAEGNGKAAGLQFEPCATRASYWANALLDTLSGAGLPSLTYTPDGEGGTNAVSASSGQNPVTGTSYNVFSEATAVNLGSGDSDAFQYDANTGRMTQHKYTVNGSSVAGASMSQIMVSAASRWQKKSLRSRSGRLQ
jgi:hypothetical protein